MVAIGTKSYGGKRWKLNCILRCRKLAEVCAEKGLEIIIDVEPQTVRKRKPISKRNYEASDAGVNEDRFLVVDDRVTTIEAINYLHNLHQTNKRLDDPDYKRTLEKIDISPSLVANADAKKILQPIRSKTIVRPKTKHKGKHLRNNDRMTSKLQKILKQRRSQCEGGKVSDSENSKLDR